jgi:hypothetical protein
MTASANLATGLASATIPRLSGLLPHRSARTGPDGIRVLRSHASACSSNGSKPCRV